jgi:hypothetical protein
VEDYEEQIPSPASSRFHPGYGTVSNHRSEQGTDPGIVNVEGIPSSAPSRFQSGYATVSITANVSIKTSAASRRSVLTYPYRRHRASSQGREPCLSRNKVRSRRNKQVTMSSGALIIPSSPSSFQSAGTTPAAREGISIGCRAGHHDRSFNIPAMSPIRAINATTPNVFMMTRLVDRYMGKRNRSFQSSENSKSRLNIFICIRRIWPKTMRPGTVTWCHSDLNQVYDPIDLDAGRTSAKQQPRDTNACYSNIVFLQKLRANQVF